LDVTQYVINAQGEIDVTMDTQFTVDMPNSTSIPFQLGTISGPFKVAGGINSLTNFPHTVNGSLSIYHSKITDLSGINKIVKRIKGNFIMGNTMTNVLGTIMIRGVVKVDGDRAKVDEILNKYLPTQDCMGAQEDMYAAGLEDQANL
jgi:hypothetical protein